MIYRDGDRFEGEYVRDRRQGQGVYYFQVRFAGGRCGTPTPRAKHSRSEDCHPPTCTAQNGDLYDGAWVDHDRTGQGVREFRWRRVALLTG